MTTSKRRGGVSPFQSSDSMYIFFNMFHNGHSYSSDLGKNALNFETFFKMPFKNGSKLIVQAHSEFFKI